LNASISSASPGFTAAHDWSSVTNTVNSPDRVDSNSDRVIGSTYGLAASSAPIAAAFG
jgi:hypothetical protein